MASFFPDTVYSVNKDIVIFYLSCAEIFMQVILQFGNHLFIADVPFTDADVAKSLLISISNDIGQIAYLTAKLHHLPRIYFGGFFIRGHPTTMHTITYAVNYWSKVSQYVL